MDEEQEEKIEAGGLASIDIAFCLYFPVRCLWLSFFCWPGVTAIAEILRVPSVGFGGTYGLVALISLWGFNLRRN